MTWRHGFVHGVRIGPPLEAHQATDIDIGVALGRVMRLPAVERVRELAIGAIEHNGDDARAALAALGPHVVLDDPQSPDDDFRYPAIR